MTTWSKFFLQLANDFCSVHNLEKLCFRLCQKEISECDAVIETPGSKNLSQAMRRKDTKVPKYNAMFSFAWQCRDCMRKFRWILQVQHMKRLQARQKALYERMLKSMKQLQSSLTRDKPTTAVTSSNVLSRVAGPSSESEKERLIRLGVMTPFGTKCDQGDTKVSWTQ